MSPNAVRMCFPATAEYLLLARLAVGGVARRLPLAEADVADLKLAVTEACGNAVRHAYVRGRPGTIELELVPKVDRLELVVEDHGRGIELPLPEAVEPTEHGGMGLAIMRAVVDELDVGPGPGGTGTVVHMTKLVPPSAAAVDGDPRRTPPEV
jgi:anti-sigma regulatory factor (Ser/Thr protein kinase)